MFLPWREEVVDEGPGIGGPRSPWIVRSQLEQRIYGFYESKTIVYISPGPGERGECPSWRGGDLQPDEDASRSTKEHNPSR